MKVREYKLVMYALVTFVAVTKYLTIKQFK